MLDRCRPQPTGVEAKPVTDQSAFRPPGVSQRWPARSIPVCTGISMRYTPLCFSHSTRANDGLNHRHSERARSHACETTY
jgi:hypothetical protein